MVLRRRRVLFAPGLVLTGRQTSGRGRGSNTWFSTRGCLTATFVLPVEAHLAAGEVPLLAGLAVRQAAQRLCASPDIKLKWPNDIEHEGRKLAGLLCERIEGVDLVGVGLNVNLERSETPAVLRGRITSLSAIAGQAVDLTGALVAVAQSLHEMFAQRGHRPSAAMMRDYDRHHALVGRQVTVHISGHEQPVAGVCEGIDQQGRLLVRRGTELHRIISGQVERV